MDWLDAVLIVSFFLFAVWTIYLVTVKPKEWPKQPRSQYTLPPQKPPRPLNRIEYKPPQVIGTVDEHWDRLPSNILKEKK